MSFRLLFLAVFAFTSLCQGLQAATLVNDFSGPVSGWYFVDNPTSVPTDFNSSATHSPLTSNLPGQVDSGFFTVNFSETTLANNIGKSASVTAFQGSLGSFDSSLGRYVGGNLFNLEGITSFLLSIRRESLNNAQTVNLHILSDQDQEYYFPVNLNLLSASMFMDISINTVGAFPAGMGAAQISVKGDSANVTPSTYNFSIDSLRAVPEPSCTSLLFSGLGSLALFRRRKS
jgi:hypothetical protein